MNLPINKPLRALFSVSDEQAMRRVQRQDDDAAFAQLVRRWERPIQNLCIRMLGDTRAGEDLAQETFLRVFSKRAEFRADATFSTWIWRIALNLCYDELRRKSRRNEMSLDEPESETLEMLKSFTGADPAPDDALAKQEQEDSVRDALMCLPAIYRTVLILRHFEDLKFREIAEVLDLPVGTIKSRVAEGLTQMRLLLKLEPEMSKPEKAPVKPNQLKESLVI
jgi:RNA polymerase sigma-70 factor (ECF subfamily)